MNVTENQLISQQSQLLLKPPVRPQFSHLDTYTPGKLFQIAKSDNSNSVAFQCLIELVRRSLEKNQELVEKIITLEQEVANLHFVTHPNIKNAINTAFLPYLSQSHLLRKMGLEKMRNPQIY